MYGRAILIVEDEYLIAQAAQEAFLNAGAVEVWLAPSVQQALLILDQHHIDFASLDINLRDETSTAVSVDLDKRGIPYLYFSATSEGIEQAQFERLIRKPALEKLVAAACTLCSDP